MRDKFGIVKDSSIWIDPIAHGAQRDKDPYVRIGIVQKVFLDQESGDFRYLVQVQDRNDQIYSTCRYMRRFGGIFNYEDVVYRGYSTTDKPDPISNFDAKAGDTVIVAFFNGQSREGIILGGIGHPGRRSPLNIDNGPQYQSEFNGVETSINKDGEYTVTFKGQPTNIAELSSVPNRTLPAPQYDTTVGSSFMSFDKTGSWTASDNSKSGIQKVYINKPAGSLSLMSGTVSTIMDKNAKSIVSSSDLFTVNAKTKIEGTTQTLKVSATTSASIKSPKVAIGTAEVELLQQLVNLIEKLGGVQVISPIGLCTPLKSAIGWGGVDGVKSKIDQIKGTF